MQVPPKAVEALRLSRRTVGEHGERTLDAVDVPTAAALAQTYVRSRHRWPYDLPMTSP